MRVTATDILDAIRKAYPAAAIVREVTIGDPIEEAIQRRHLLDGPSSQYYRRSIEAKGLPVADSIPEGWDPTTSKAFRRIDALMRESAGYTAIEIKISRGDFKRDTDLKRRVWQAHSRRFIYAAPAGLLNPSEIPDGCGLWELNDRGYVMVAKKAKINKSPAGLPIEVLDSMLYRVSNYERAELATRKDQP